MNIESMLYEKINEDIIICKTCSRNCRIANGEFGFCNTKFNEENILYSNNYGVVSSIALDPIEKKPLSYFLPGTYTLSIGTFGCNMSCLNCQNYTISQNLADEYVSRHILPERLIEIAVENDSPSISWTYNEPTISLEYNLKTAKLAMEKNLKNIYVTNGYMSDEALDYILKYIDAFSVDLKSMSNDFYNRICGASVDPVLRNVKRIHDSGKHIELDYLIIPGFNDTDEDLKLFVDFVANDLSCDVPVHFLRFRPEYKMMNISYTPIETIENAYEIAEDAGLANF